MKKTKKTKDSKKGSLFGGAGKSLKKMGKSTRKLSAGQKWLGGAALLALGVGWLASRRGGLSSALPGADAQAADLSLASMEGQSS